MANSMWAIGINIEDSNKSLLEIVNDADKYSKDEIVQLIANEAEDLKNTYNDLAREQGWI